MHTCIHAYMHAYMHTYNVFVVAVEKKTQILLDRIEFVVLLMCYLNILLLSSYLDLISWHWLNVSKKSAAYGNSVLTLSVFHRLASAPAYCKTKDLWHSSAMKLGPGLSSDKLFIVEIKFCRKKSV